MEKVDDFKVFKPTLRVLVPFGVKVKGGRWVKTKKGDEVRCRWVMQDFNDGSGDKNDFYANTPNVAALRCQLAVCSGEMNEVRREGSIV